MLFYRATVEEFGENSLDSEKDEGSDTTEDEGSEATEDEGSENDDDIDPGCEYYDTVCPVWIWNIIAKNIKQKSDQIYNF